MFENITPETKKRDLLTALETYGGGMSTREGSFADTVLGGVAVEHCKVLHSLNALLSIFYVDEQSGGFIDIAAARYNILRKPGTAATVEMTLMGKAGTKVPKGTVFLTAGGLEFMAEAAVVLTGKADKCRAVAGEVGAAYNVEAGELTQMVMTVAGLDTWTNARAEGGTDEESDEALLGRLYDHWRNPSTSGNIHDYKRWALAVPGVGDAKIFPLWKGPGTVRVLIVDGEKKPATPAIVAAVEASIEDNRPVGAAVTVASATALPIRVAYTAVLEGSVTAEQVKTAFVASLDAYVKDIAFREYTLLYNRVVLLLLSIPGVRDYQTITVNGGTVNVTIGADQVPVLGEVTLI